MYLANLKKERKLPVKSEVDFRIFLAVCCDFFLSFQVSDNVLAEDEDVAAHRTATAMRITGAPPRLDGVLGRRDMEKVLPSTKAFANATQMKQSPKPSALPSKSLTMTRHSILRSCVMIMNPIKLSPGWSGETTDIESDRVTVSLAPHPNRQRGFWFTAYSSGSVTDGTVTDEYNPPFDDNMGRWCGP